MTALTDHAAGFHREKNLEPRELRVGVEEQDADKADGHCEPLPAVHVVPLAVDRQTVVVKDSSQPLDAFPVAVSGTREHKQKNEHPKRLHHSPPVELVPTPCRAGEVAAQADGWSAFGRHTASSLWAVVVIRRPNRYREWRWSL
jgi:hypothetical protein